MASMFQNDISRNTKCAERDGFRRADHMMLLRECSIRVFDAYNIIYTHLYKHFTNVLLEYKELGNA